MVTDDVPRCPCYSNASIGGMVGNSIRKRNLFLMQRSVTGASGRLQFGEVSES